jgi:hypothetical protein
MPTVPELLDGVATLDSLSRTENPLGGTWKIHPEANNIGQAATGWTTQTLGQTAGAKWTGAVPGAGETFYAVVMTNSFALGEDTQVMRIGWGTTVAEIKREASTIGIARLKVAGSIIGEAATTTQTADRWALETHSGKLTIWRKRAGTWTSVLTKESGSISETKEPFIFFDPNSKSSAVFRITNFGASSLTAEGKATISGSGSITAKGQKIPSTTGSVSGTGEITAKGVATRLDKATIAGSGSISAVGKRIALLLGSAKISGTGTITSKGVRIRLDTASINGTSTISAAGQTKALILGAATVTGTGLVSAKGLPIKLGKATIQGTGLVNQVVGALGSENFFILYKGALRPVGITLHVK